MFTDEDTGFKRNNLFPSILIDAGLKVECLGDHFDTSVQDHEWLSLCGDRGWLAVTRDKRIRFSEVSKRAIVRANTRVLTLIGKWSHKQLADNLVNSIYVVESKVKKERPPCILKLHMAPPTVHSIGRAGKVEVYRNCEDLISGLD